MNLKEIGKVFTSKFVGTGPSSYEKRIYRAAVSQSLRNTAIERLAYKAKYTFCAPPPPTFRKSTLFPQRVFNLLAP